MITENQIQEILAELYVLEPALRSQEDELRKLVVGLAELKPDTKFDRAFALRLRQTLLQSGAAGAYKNNFLKNIINLTFMKKINYVLGGVAVLVLIIGGYFAGQKHEQQIVVNSGNLQQASQTAGQNPAAAALLGSKEQAAAVSQVKKFSSEQEFKDYLANSQASGIGLGGGMGGGVAMPMNSTAAGTGGAQKESLAMPAQAPAPPDRVSQTNVQVAGIDEPDIVKTDGQNLYVSANNFYPIYYGGGPQPMPMVKSAPVGGETMPVYRPPAQTTNVIAAVPPSALKALAKIDKQGNLLLYQDTLMIFTYDTVYGYSIKDPANPAQLWQLSYKNNSQLVTARLYNGLLYLVTSSYPNFDKPCPIVPMSIGGTNIEMPCREIYHPIVPISDVTTYGVVLIDPQSGEVKNKLSFVGSSGQAVVYMSPNALYLTYTYAEDQVKIALDFLKTNGSGLFPNAVVARLAQVESYDLSVNAKMVELQDVLSRYMNSLNPDDSRTLQNNIQNKLGDYLKQHIRDLQFTGIVKVPLDKLTVASSGNVPGSPLNQFSLDEYQGNLRIATTVTTNGIAGLGGWGNQASANDVYVLDGNLSVIGKITDLGQGERIYSVRFIDGQGYLVTFKQTDPFYVLDLSDPKNPQMKGQLKIPGYSSYLHPLAPNRILGVGEEGNQVKLSLFDVSNPANPVELDKYQLAEYWTDVSNNYHAFLQDAGHQVFFLPGGNTGYIFSYQGDRLSLQKSISQIQAQRAVYINDTMYIIGSDKVVSVDEKTWERVGELSLQ